MGQAWDLSSSGSYDSVSLDLSSQLSIPQALDFSADGKFVYAIGSRTNSVFQYIMTTPWDLSTASYSEKSFSVGAQSRFSDGIRFKPDGLTMYVTSSRDSVFQYSLSTAWDVSTATYTNKNHVFIAEEISNLHGIAFKNDGTKFFVADSNDNKVLQYSLSTAWDISTATYDAVAIGASSSVTRGIFFKADGLILYLASSSPDATTQYDIK